MDDDAAIRQLVADRTAAMGAGDAHALCAGYTADAVVFSLASPLRQPPGSSRDVARLQAWLDEKGGRVHAQVRDLQVTADGDVAFCTSLQSMGAPPDAPQPFTL